MVFYSLKKLNWNKIVVLTFNDITLKLPIFKALKIEFLNNKK